MNTIILNAGNKVPNTTNRYLYRFPSAVKFSKEDTIALQSISIYNSFFNIEQSRNNNRFNITWNANTSVTHNFLIPDSFMDVEGINAYIQQQCLLNNLYMLDADGKNWFFIELQIHPTTYGVQLRIYPLPTEADANEFGLVIPTGANWTLPTTKKTPQFTFDQEAFGDLIGFKVGTYPVQVLTTDTQILNTHTPQISPVNSILLGINLINSPFSIPSSLFFALPVNAKFGGMIINQNGNPIFNQICAGVYSNIVIELYDQHFNPLRMNDDEITLLLNIVMK